MAATATRVDGAQTGGVRSTSVWIRHAVIGCGGDALVSKAAEGDDGERVVSAGEQCGALGEVLIQIRLQPDLSQGFSGVG